MQTVYIFGSFLVCQRRKKDNHLILDHSVKSSAQPSSEYVSFGLSKSTTSTFFISNRTIDLSLTVEEDRIRNPRPENLDSRMQDEGDDHELGSSNFLSLEWSHKSEGLLACSSSLGIEEVVYILLWGRIRRRGTFGIVKLIVRSPCRGGESKKDDLRWIDPLRGGVVMAIGRVIFLGIQQTEPALTTISWCKLSLECVESVKGLAGRLPRSERILSACLQYSGNIDRLGGILPRQLVGSLCVEREPMIVSSMVRLQPLLQRHPLV